MVEAWMAHKTIIIIFVASILLGVVIGLWWGHHTVRAPFRERRLQKRTLWQRLRWTFDHRIKPVLDHR